MVDADSYEDSVKNPFVDGEIDILIVCSKLLIGFDAPRCPRMSFDYYKEIIRFYRKFSKNMDIAKVEEYVGKFKHSDKIMQIIELEVL